MEMEELSAPILPDGVRPRVGVDSLSLPSCLVEANGWAIRRHGLAPVPFAR